MKKLLVAALLLSPALAHAQTKMPIYVDCDARDSDEVAKGLCSSLRDAIAKSPRYMLLTSPGKEAHYVIIVASDPLNIKGVTGAADASSWVFGYAFGADAVRFLSHAVTVTSLDKVAQQAAGMLVDFDTLIDSIFKKSKP